jgi:polyferredoxin
MKSSSSHIKLPSNRKFGFFFTAIFTLIGMSFFSDESAAVSYTLFFLATILLVITIINSNMLLPLNKLWMKLGLLLGMIVSPIVLGIIFFGLFTPISLLMKLFGRDELRLKLVARPTHWKERDANTSQTDTFKYQF